MRPILFQWGPFTLYSYGLLLAIGFLAAVSVAMRRAVRQGIDPEKVQTICILALISGLIGARLAYVGLNYRQFMAVPLEIIRLDHGGLVFYGGLIGGVTAVAWYLKKAGLSVGPTLDLLVPPLILAHAFGRIGCFLNGCCYGAPTDLPWGVEFHQDAGAWFFAEGIHRHPTQLYEALVLFGFFVLFSRWKMQRPGFLLFLYGLFYGVWRFINEFLRADNLEGALGLTVFQWVSIGLVSVCALILIKKKRV